MGLLIILFEVIIHMYRLLCVVLILDVKYTLSRIMEINYDDLYLVFGRIGLIGMVKLVRMVELYGFERSFDWRFGRRLMEDYFGLFVIVVVSSDER